MAGRIDVKQIDKNRRLMNDSTVESPYNTVLEDSDSDLPECLYDRVPGDRVGFLPSNEKKR